MVTPIRSGSVETEIKELLGDETQSTAACEKLNKIVTDWLAKVDKVGNTTVTLQELDSDYELGTTNLARNASWLRKAVSSHPGYQVSIPARGATTVGNSRPLLTVSFTITKTAAGTTPPTAVPEVKT